MENKYRAQCVLLGLVCLMPALLFWAISSLPVDMNNQPVFVFFSEISLMEFVICGFVFPLLAVGLGWNAYKRCENKALSLTVIGIGLIEFVASVVAALLGKGF